MTTSATSDLSNDPLQTLLEAAARALSDEPDKIHIKVVRGDQVTVFELTVASGDTGKIIGRSGRNAAALRTLLQSSAARLHRRVVLDILDAPNPA